MQTEKISQTILLTARERGPSKSTCPSEIARALFPSDWRKHMVEIKDAAIALHQTGEVLLTQKGKTIDTAQIKGPTRIRISE